MLNSSKFFTSTLIFQFFLNLIILSPIAAFTLNTPYLICHVTSLPITVLLSGPPSPLYIAPVCSPLPPPLPLVPPLWHCPSVNWGHNSSRHYCHHSLYCHSSPGTYRPRSLIHVLYTNQIHKADIHQMCKFVRIRQRIHNIVRILWYTVMDCPFTSNIFLWKILVNYERNICENSSEKKSANCVFFTL